MLSSKKCYKCNDGYTSIEHNFTYLYESGVTINHRVIYSCFSAEIGFLPIVAFSSGPINDKIISNVVGYNLKY